MVCILFLFAPIRSGPEARGTVFNVTFGCEQTFPISSFMSIFSQTPTSPIQNTSSQMKQCWVNKAHETISRYLSKYRSFPLFCYMICDSVFVWRFKFLPYDASTISFPPQNLRSPCFSFSSSSSALLWLVRSHFLVVSICSQCHFEWVHIEPYSNFGANKWKCFLLRLLLWHENKNIIIIHTHTKIANFKSNAAVK